MNREKFKNRIEKFYMCHPVHAIAMIEQLNKSYTVAVQCKIIKN